MSKTENPSRPGAGTASIWTAVAGIVVPVAVFLLSRAVFQGDRVLPLFLVATAMFTLLQGTAIATGIVGRRSAAGVFGLVISINSVLLYGFFVIFIVPALGITG